jgi:Tol biopolymer transport system component/DNA-binding winged helix-turn-helix (wHTH) protein
MPSSVRKHAPFPAPRAERIGFDLFEVDLRSGELRKNGRQIRLPAQPFQLLEILLEHSGEVVTREEVCRKLWPGDTFVDFDHGLASAVNKIRAALGDSAENPRFVETLPKRGYRFIGTIRRDPPAPRMTDALMAEEVDESATVPQAGSGHSTWLRTRAARYSFATGVALLLALAVFLNYRKQAPVLLRQRGLSRVTFDDGLQIGATWSPDSRYIAYSSDRGGKFNVWVQPITSGDPVQITKGEGHNWQPSWSPDGKYIAYRSEEGGGGLFVVPALGGVERRIAAFGYYPRWSPDSSQILFQTTKFLGMNRFYVVTLDGSQPREVLTEFRAQHKPAIISAAWHPDGKRISAWVWESAYGPNFWTVPLAGGVGIKSELSPEVAKQVKEVAGGIVEWSMDFTFSWAPSGRAIYYARTFRGARNLWRMTIDPGTLRGTAIERITTGPGPDAELALSPDGRKLAFTGEVQHIRAWLFPFDASHGKLTGHGQAVTPSGMATWRQSLSRDGRKLAFSCNRAGRSELWEMSLLDPHIGPLVVDDQFRDFPVWASDGKHLAYERYNFLTEEGRLVLWSPESHSEEAISDSAETAGLYDWSLDGKALLVSQLNENVGRQEIWLLPLAAAPNAEKSGRKIISNATYDLDEPHFSPDGRWIAFQAVRDLPTDLESTIYVMPTSGGPWIPITDGKHWDDKPRWSSDGRMIYFVSGRGSSFFNVWGIRFDPTQGRPTGLPFEITKFESPAMMVPQHIPSVELSVSRNHLVLTVEQVSGSIWVLDNLAP